MKRNIEPWRKNLSIIWGAQFLAMMGMSLVVPFLPFYIRELGVSDPNDVARWSGLVYAGPFFLSFFFTPIWGILGDRYGRKAMTTRAIFGLAISQVLIGFAQNVEMLLAFRMIQGILSGFIASTLALVSASTPREKSGYAIGILQTASSSGTVIGPFIGGSLADLFGYRPLFFIVGGICTLAGVIIVKFVQEVKEQRDTSVSLQALFENYTFSLKTPQIRIALWLILLSQVAMVMIQPIFPLFIDSLGTNKEYLATIAGTIFSITGLFMVISSPWWGKRNDAKSYRKNLKLAILGASVSYALQGLVSDAYQLIFLRAAQGFCMGGILPSLYSYVNKNCPPGRRGALMGIASSVNILASMIGPPFGGFIAAQFGLRQNFFITGGLLLTAVLFVHTSFIDLKGNEARTARAAASIPEPGILDEAN